MSKEIMQQALTVLKAWDALIKYQYGGSSEAMTAMQNVAWRTPDTIEGLETALAQTDQDHKPWCNYLNIILPSLPPQKAKCNCKIAL